MKILGHNLSTTGTVAGSISILGVLGAVLPMLQAVQKACPNLPPAWITGLAGVIAIIGTIITFLSHAPTKAEVNHGP